MKQYFQMLKLLKNEPKIDVLPNADFQLKDVGICLWELDPSLTYLPKPPMECPVCGSSQFEEGQRLSALLNPRFVGGVRYVMLVWVHPDCFNDCVETSEPEPQPW